MAVVVAIFHQHFVRANGVHTVIETVPTTPRLALDAVQRLGMNHGSRGPGSPRSIGGRRDDLLRRLAKTAGGLQVRSGVAGIVAGNDPRPSNRVFAQFHSSKKEEHRRRTPLRDVVNTAPHSRESVRSDTEEGEPLCYNPRKPAT